MRYYLGITGTGGKVAGSFEVGEIVGQLMKVKTNNVYNKIGGYTLGDNISRYINLENAIKQGYTNQKFAIQIKDFREECIYLTDYCEGCSKPFTGWQHDIEDCASCFDDLRGRVILKWQGEDYDDLVKRLPQSFQYIICPETGEKAILVSIHQKWFDMIKSGEKKYEFRNVLPKALRGEKQ